ncbi:DUF397 domain-containing protein [Streptomyces tateyamensis]|uniref:DUF397 domain-containing protein n=1 Tax=Streptomyces tateyamensis TaxID=565073 RepID=A0A2V4PAH4_9ACTN|nr:DUF397 domain-containing protein [Streptomyces tateyamensis]PYC87897.1 DUF397 domain-containing protein [Streptomyces tateyamensis]
MSTDLTSAHWRKSTHSTNGGQCVEIADNLAGLTPVRDSKDPDGPSLAFPGPSFAAFLTALRLRALS